MKRNVTLLVELIKVTCLLNKLKIFKPDNVEDGAMQDTKYVCPNCGYEAIKPGVCPHCQVALVATCPACGNPIVGDCIPSES